MKQDPSIGDFLDFASYTQVNTVPKGVSGSLVKANKVICAGAQVIEVTSSDDDQPTVITRNEGGAITAVEFTCKCGRSSLVELSYDHS